MITYHHIGGRSGTFPIPLKNVSFSTDVHLVLYEADVDCFEEILKAEKGAFGKITVNPYCIGGETGMGSLHVNFHPTTTSLYPFNDEFADYTRVSNPIYEEYRLGDACQLVKKVSLPLLSLTDALKKTDILEIDFLSIDIQGAEYDVLAGSKEFIKKNCLGLQLEVEFAKIYKDQKSAFELNQLMEELGFELIELNSFGRYAPISMPIGFRGEEQLIYGEAIYIKKLDVLVEDKNAEKLYKWALFALINNKIGLCLQALRVLSTLEQDPELDKFSYILLLKKIWVLYQEEESCKLPHLSELFSQEILGGFYQGIPNDSKKFTEENKKIRTHLKNKYIKFLPKIEGLEKETETPFELLLKQHGLFTVADTVKKNRIQEAAYFLQLLNSLGDDQKNWRNSWIQKKTCLI